MHRDKVIQLYQLIQADIGRDLPYNTAGDRSIISSVIGPTGAHNCFTWAREKLLLLKDHTITADIQPESFKDLIISRPKNYLQETSPHPNSLQSFPMSYYLNTQSRNEISDRTV